MQRKLSDEYQMTGFRWFQKYLRPCTLDGTNLNIGRVSYAQLESAIRREGRFEVLHRFQQLRSYRDKIETRNLKEITFSIRIVPRGLSFADGP